jgi:hypothetical protein
VAAWVQEMVKVEDLQMVGLVVLVVEEDMVLDL